MAAHPGHRERQPVLVPPLRRHVEQVIGAVQYVEASGHRSNRCDRSRDVSKLYLAWVSTMRCRDTAGSDMSNGRASSPTVAALVASRARIARPPMRKHGDRVGFRSVAS